VRDSADTDAETRGKEPFTRVTLAVAHVPGVKDEGNSEADVAVKNLLELAPLLGDGVQGALCDTVLRGTHIDALQRSTGWLIMNPVTAARVNKKTGERTEKESYLRREVFHYQDGTHQQVDIWVSGGRACRLVHLDDGDPVLRNLAPRNTDGTYRNYVEYEVPCPRRGKPKIIRERTYGKPEDGDFNRAENVRQILPGDPDYERLKGLRSDAEATNRQIDDHLYLRRARSLGAHRELLDLIAHAFVWNSVARYRYRTADPPTAIAA
jgi:hypothetical protein